MSDERGRNIDRDTVEEFAKDAPDRWSKLQAWARNWKQAAKYHRDEAMGYLEAYGILKIKHETAEAEVTRLSEAETRLRGLVDLVNKYAKTRDITDRKAMFALAEELRDE